MRDDCRSRRFKPCSLFGVPPVRRKAVDQSRVKQDLVWMIPYSYASLDDPRRRRAISVLLYVSRAKAAKHGIRVGRGQSMLAKEFRCPNCFRILRNASRFAKFAGRNGRCSWACQNTHRHGDVLQQCSTRPPAESPRCFPPAFDERASSVSTGAAPPAITPSNPTRSLIFCSYIHREIDLLAGAEK